MYYLTALCERLCTDRRTSTSTSTYRLYLHLHSSSHYVQQQRGCQPWQTKYSATKWRLKYVVKVRHTNKDFWAHMKMGGFCEREGCQLCSNTTVCSGHVSISIHLPLTHLTHSLNVNQHRQHCWQKCSTYIWASYQGNIQWVNSGSTWPSGRHSEEQVRRRQMSADYVCMHHNVAQNTAAGRASPAATTQHTAVQNTGVGTPTSDVGWLRLYAS